MNCTLGRLSKRGQSGAAFSEKAIPVGVMPQAVESLPKPSTRADFRSPSRSMRSVSEYTRRALRPSRICNMGAVVQTSPLAKKSRTRVSFALARALISARAMRGMLVFMRRSRW